MEVAMEPQHTAGFIFGHHFPAQPADRRLATVLEEGNSLRCNNDSRHSSSPDSDDMSAKRQRTGYACAPCNMSFTEKRALARHRKTDHHRRQIGLPPDRRHACFVCGKHFTRGHDLKRHQNEQHTDIVAPPAEISSAGSEYSLDRGSSEEHPQRASPAECNVAATVSSGPPAPIYLPSSSHSIYSESNLAFADFMDVRDHSRATRTDYSTSGHYADSVVEGSGFALAIQVPDLYNLPELMDTDSSNWSPQSDRSVVSQGSDIIRSPGDQSGILSMHSTASQLQLADIEKHTTPMFPRDVDVDTWQQQLTCMVCGIPYEDDPEELVGHLRRHLDTSRGAHQCTECLIGFVHEEDLERHLQCAAEGHCGFSFPHTVPCTGHHPPRSGSNLAGLSDNDRIRLSDRLSHWEQAQLRAYITEIDGLLAARRNPRAPRWSDVIRTTSRRNSQASLAISIKTFASAPCDGNEAVGGLQRRMQKMSLGNTRDRVSRMIRSGSSQSHDALNKQLKKAVKHGQLSKIAQYLDAGGDHSIVQNEDSFVTIALWGHGYVAERMAEHRLDEDLKGKCSKCKVKNVTFDGPASKVKALLRHGAGANRQGGLCGYPLVTAAWLGRPDVVKVLLDHDASIDLHASKYGTALCAAASQAGSLGHTQVISLLLEYGADPTFRILDGTALQLARKRLDSWTAQAFEMTSDVHNCQQAVLALEHAESSPIQIIPRSVASKKRLRTVASEPAMWMA